MFFYTFDNLPSICWNDCSLSTTGSVALLRSGPLESTTEVVTLLVVETLFKIGVETPLKIGVETPLKIGVDTFKLATPLKRDGIVCEALSSKFNILLLLIFNGSCGTDDSIIGRIDALVIIGEVLFTSSRNISATSCQFFSKLSWRSKLGLYNERGKKKMKHLTISRWITCSYVVAEFNLLQRAGQREGSMNKENRFSRFSKNLNLPQNIGKILKKCFLITGSGQRSNRS